MHPHPKDDRVHAPPFNTWGDGVLVKGNAASLLADYLKKAPAGHRRSLRIFMSTTTDPYQGPEAKHEITRHLLDVFSQYDDLDLLVVQTRSPLAERDIQLMRKIPYLWLSVTVETDDQEMLTELRGGPPIAKRLHLVRAAVEQGIKTQIAVSPMLPPRDPVAFASLRDSTPAITARSASSALSTRGSGRVAQSLRAT